MADKLTVELFVRDDKKHSVKFSTRAEGAFLDNVYVKKDQVPPGCKGVRVTVEFLTE